MQKVSDRLNICNFVSQILDYAHYTCIVNFGL